MLVTSASAHIQPGSPCAGQSDAAVDLQGVRSVDIENISEPVFLLAEVGRRHNFLEASGNTSPALSFGVTLVGPAWSDEYLWRIATDLQEMSGVKCGPAGHGLKPYRAPQA